MKFNLKRQTISEDILKIVSRTWKKKDLDSYNLTKKNLKELSKVLNEIEQWTLPRYLVRVKLKGKLGYGIFLHPKAEPILAGQVIAPYAGEVSIVPQNETDDADYAFDPVTDFHLTKEEQAKFDPKKRYHPRRLYALKLDAAKKGNFTRFINHSDKPNVVAYLVSSRSNPYEIIYFAKKTIRPGEQLLVCYEDDQESYWGVLGIKPFPMTPQTFRLPKTPLPDA
ncbi:MAG: SET domain-containing protein [Chlamydiales bacterium]